MYKIAGILFCLLQGVLVAKFGWVASLWAPLGFIIGLFLTANMILPILMGIPVALTKILKKELRTSVLFAVLRTPLIWFILLFLFGWFFPSAVYWISRNETLNIGITYGVIVIVLSPLFKKGRDDFSTDFDKSYSRYSVEQNNINNQFKQVINAIKVFSNLYYHTTSTSKSVLSFNYPDSKFRYMIFCMSVFFKACDDFLIMPTLLINECLNHLSQIITSNEDAKEFVGSPITPEEFEKKGLIYLNEFMKRWNLYSEVKTNGDKSIDLIASMICFTESNEKITIYDINRLRELSFEIQNFMPAMREAFIELNKHN